MKKEFNITGMTCNHCRLHVEKALNGIDGVHATVSLDPPVAKIAFTGEEKTVGELQNALSETGDYIISAK